MSRKPKRPSEGDATQQIERVERQLQRSIHQSSQRHQESAPLNFDPLDRPLHEYADPGGDPVEAAERLHALSQWHRRPTGSFCRLIRCILVTVYCNRDGYWAWIFTNTGGRYHSTGAFTSARAAMGRLTR
jgi:hypothetical protein